MNYDNFPFFIFNGIKSTNLGIIIKELPPITKSEKNIDSISISGSNRILHIDNGTYKSKTYKVDCILNENANINYIKTLLDSTGILELSSEPGIEYRATVKNQIDFSKYLTYLKSFSITFELDPIGYNKTATVKTLSSSSNEFTVGGTADVYPSLVVNGIGKFSLNNVQVEVLESGITIDCELMNCTKNGINKNDKVILDVFPKLVVGTNTLTIISGVTSVEVTYKEGWL